MGVDDYEARKIYAANIISLWLECIDKSHAAKMVWLSGASRDEDAQKVIFEYIARLARLWKELKPKVKNRAELKDLEKQYMSFEPSVANLPSLVESPEKIDELEDILCQVLDALRVTELENLR